MLLTKPISIVEYLKPTGSGLRFECRSVPCKLYYDVKCILKRNYEMPRSEATIRDCIVAFCREKKKDLGTELSKIKAQDDSQSRRTSGRKLDGNFLCA